MSVLNNSKHEQFAQLVAKGVNATKAYVSAGYSGNGARGGAARLYAKATVCARIRELQKTLSAGTIALEITSRNARVTALQKRWDSLRADEVKGKAQGVKGESNEKLRKVMNDPTLEGKNENEVGRIQPKPEHALEN